MNPMYWHRAPDDRWHQFNRDRSSTCGGWVFLGVPDDARVTKGPGAYCTSCVKADRRRRRLARSSRKWKAAGGRLRS